MEQNHVAGNLISQRKINKNLAVLLLQKSIVQYV